MLFTLERFCSRSRCANQFLVQRDITRKIQVAYVAFCWQLIFFWSPKQYLFPVVKHSSNTCSSVVIINCQNKTWISLESFGLESYVAECKDNFYMVVFLKVFLYMWGFYRVNFSWILGTSFSYAVADGWCSLDQHNTHFHLRIYAFLSMKKSSITEPVICFPSYSSLCYIAVFSETHFMTKHL